MGMELRCLWNRSQWLELFGLVSVVLGACSPAMGICPKCERVGTSWACLSAPRGAHSCQVTGDSCTNHGVCGDIAGPESPTHDHHISISMGFFFEVPESCALQSGTFASLDGLDDADSIRRDLALRLGVRETEVVLRDFDFTVGPTSPYQPVFTGVAAGRDGYLTQRYMDEAGNFHMSVCRFAVDGGPTTLVAETTIWPDGGVFLVPLALGSKNMVLAFREELVSDDVWRESEMEIQRQHRFDVQTVQVGQGLGLRFAEATEVCGTPPD